MIDISEQVKKHIESLGADLVGFAKLTELPEESRWGYEYGISIAVAYEPEELYAISDIPNDRYYSAYKRLDKKLDEIAVETEKYLTDAGYRARAITRESRTITVKKRRRGFP